MLELDEIIQCAFMLLFWGSTTSIVPIALA
jgi:hypothetical protein